MLIGALLDLGLDFAALQAELSRLSLPGYRLQAERVQKGSISATSFKVILEDVHGARLADSEFSEVKGPGELGQPGKGEQIHAHSRGLAEILALIQASDLSAAVKQRAAQVFTRLGEAEGRVHGLPPEQVHFHEVGAVDALVDIVGACIGLELLGVEQVYASALHLGGGFVRSAHGLLPVPAPATAELLAGVPVYTTQMSGELVTPTGAAILTTIASAFGPLPVMTVGGIGYGAGSRDREFPNVLRVMLGDMQPSPRQAQPAEQMQFASTGLSSTIPPVNRDPFPEQHDVPVGNSGWHDGAAVVIEANLDDMSPQLFENLLDRLLAEGALDVLLIPAQMKKGRPGMLLQVLAHPDSSRRAAEGDLPRIDNDWGAHLSSRQTHAPTRNSYSPDALWGGSR